MIRKYQIGATVNYLASANPNVTPQEQETQTKSTKKDPLVSESLLNDLYSKGIPVDVDVVANDIARIETKQQRGMPVSATELNQVRAKINRVIKASEYYDKARKNAADNDALGEIAVTDRGELFVWDGEKHQVKKVSKHDFNAQEQVALTVGELIDARANSPRQAFDTTTIAAIGNSVGMSVISDRIKTIIDIVGSSTSTSEAYTDLASYVGAQNAKRPTQSEFNTLQIMANAVQNGALDQNTIYKISQTVGSKNMNDALDYICRVLPRNMQEQMQGRLVAMGYTVEQARQEMGKTIISAVSAANVTTDNFKIDMAPQYVQESSGKGSSKTFYQTVTEAIFDPEMNNTEINLRSGFGSGGNSDIQLTVQGALFNSPLYDDHNNKNQTDMPLSLALKNSVTQYIDTYHMFAGTEKVSSATFDKFLYNNDGQAVVWMPVNRNGDIDWASYQGAEKAEKIIKERGYVNDDDKNKVHAECGSFCRYQNGKLDKIPGIEVARYLMTYAYALDDDINEDENTMIEKMTGKQEDYIQGLYDRVFNDELEEKLGYKNSRRFWDDIYKVPIFMKINESAAFDVYRYNGHGALMTPNTLEQDMRQQERQRRIEHPVVNGNADIAYSE